MKPLTKLYSIVFTFTTTIIFVIWGYIETLVISNPMIGIPLSAFIALGTYRAILDSTKFLINSISILKKFVYGSYYLEGTWVGCYLNSNRDPVYFIENYEQDFDNLIVRGRAYERNGSYKGSWVSEKVSIDIEKGRIAYNYVTDFINNTHLNQGQAFFDIIRKDSKSSGVKLIGFTSDLFNGHKIKSFEVKVANNNEDIELLMIAVKNYYKNKEFFNNHI